MIWAITQVSFWISSLNGINGLESYWMKRPRRILFDICFPKLLNLFRILLLIFLRFTDATGERMNVVNQKRNRDNGKLGMRFWLKMTAKILIINDIFQLQL